MNNYDQPPVEDKKEDLEIEPNKTEDEDVVNRESKVDMEELEENDFQEAKREVGFWKGELASSFGRSVEINLLNLGDDIEKWQKLGNGLKSIAKEFRNDKRSRSEKSAEYEEKVAEFLNELKETNNLEKQETKQETVENSKMGEPFREAEYEKFKGYLEEFLPKFDSRTLNEAKKYVDDLIQKKYEDGNDKDCEMYQDFSEAINDLMSLKSLNMEKTLDSFAQHKFFNFKRIAEETLNLLDDFKSENTERGGKYDVGTLIYHLKEAVTNLAEFKYPELIKEQYKQRYEAKNKKDIEKAKEELNKMNISG